MRSTAAQRTRGLRALLSILPVRAVGRQVVGGCARGHHARDARTGVNLHLGGPLLLVGAGKMGGTMLAGWLRQGLDPASVYVQDPTPAPEVSSLMASHGIRVRYQAKLPDAPSVIVLAVKPQIMDEVLPSLGVSVGPSTVVLSIAAGRT